MSTFGVIGFALSTLLMVGLIRLIKRVKQGPRQRQAPPDDPFSR